MPNQPVFLDHAATTPVEPAVFEAMAPYLQERFGNPASLYGLAREARRAIDRAREQVAAWLGGKPTEVVFTSGGTEACNLAVRGVALASRAQGRGNHLVLSAVEHLAVLDAARALERDGFRLSLIPVEADGLVDLDALEAALTDETALVAVILASNEIGTIQPLAEISRRVTAFKPVIPVFADACVAAPVLDLNVSTLGVDLLAVSAHKVCGPKGVGALWIRRGVPLQAQAWGGTHERGRRPGTENVAGIVGLGRAAEIVRERRESDAERLAALRDRLIAGVLERVPGARLTGHPTRRLPHLASFAFEHVEGESLLLQLDLNGVQASSGSACTTASLEPSHVLLALGLAPTVAHGSLRLSLGRASTEIDVARVLELLPGIVTRLRAISPMAAQGPGL